MKKIVLTLVAVMSMTMTFAAGENTKNAANNNAYKMNVSMYSLSRALELNSDQYDMVEIVNHNFSADLQNASYANESDRDEMVKKAVKKNVSYMRTILNNRQYRAYLKFLNLTLKNRGLEK